MTEDQIKIAVLATLGLTAPFWWTILVSKLIYCFYLVGGAPERPTALFAWSSLLFPSVGLGLLAGFVVLLLSRTYPIFGWSVFIGCLALSIVAGAIYSGSLGPIKGIFGNFSNIAFLFATVLIPLWATLKSGSGLTSIWSRRR